MIRSQKGRFTPQNPKKYSGDSNNIIYRSNLEKRFMKYFDMHDSILTWASEEIAIPYLDPITGRRKRYFPDFLVKIKKASGELAVYMIEVKPYTQTYLKENARTASQIYHNLRYGRDSAKWAAATDFCKSKNWKFIVMTDKDLLKK